MGAIVPEALTGVGVRPMEESDLPAILALERASFSVPWSLQSFQQILRDRTVRSLVLVRGAEVAGYAVFWVVGDFAELANLAVDPTLRRQGLGAHLLRAVIGRCRALGGASLFLEVRASNAAARALYQLHGFRPVSRRRRYYQVPVEDALVYRLDI